MVAWHPRGEVLASCSYDNSIKLWVMDGDDWVCAQTLEGERAAPGAAACAPGQLQRPLTGAATAVDLVPGACRLTSGHAACRLLAAAGPLAHESTVWCIAFTRDGQHMASCSDDRTVKASAAAGLGGGRGCRAWTAHAQPLCEASSCLCCWRWGKAGAEPRAADGQAFINVGVRAAGARLQVWECRFRGAEPAFVLSASISGHHDRTIYSLDWSCDDAYLATGGSLARVPCPRALAVGSAHPAQAEGRARRPGVHRGSKAARGCIEGHAQAIPARAHTAWCLSRTAGSGTNSIQLFTRAGGDAGPQSSDHPPGSGATEGSPGSLSPEAAANGQGVQEGPQGGSWQEAARVQQAHELDVNCVRWHPHHAWLLASASDDGSIKLWRHTRADAPLQRLQV